MKDEITYIQKDIAKKKCKNHELTNLRKLLDEDFLTAIGGGATRAAFNRLPVTFENIPTSALPNRRNSAIAVGVSISSLSWY